MKPSIRNAEIDDIEAIMLIEKDSFHENIVESLETFLERIRVFPDGFLVLEIKGRVIGYISSELWEYLEETDAWKFGLDHGIADTHRVGGQELYISSIGILGEHRGKGYGDLLFSELERRIRGKYGIKSIILIVSGNWTAARKIYERNGFRDIGEIPGFFGDEENSAAIVMRKVI